MKKLNGIFTAIWTGLICFFLAPGQVVWAVSEELNLDVADPQVAPMPSMFGLLAKLVVSLVIIAFLAYWAMRFLKKNMQVLSRGSNIHVLDQYAFSMNKGLYITQVADKVYVLGITDHSISVISEITDENTIAEIVARAREKQEQSIIPAGFLDKVLQNPLGKKVSQQLSFNEHIQKQIKKLQDVIDKTGSNPREGSNHDQNK